MSLVYGVHEDDKLWNVLTHFVEAAVRQFGHSPKVIKDEPNMNVRSTSLICQFEGSLLDS